MERKRKGQQKRSDEFWEKEGKSVDWYWQTFCEAKALASYFLRSLPREDQKVMSWLDPTRGGALIKPPQVKLSKLRRKKGILR